jgi:NAD(P)-dependent dehydrogenase (short-subunit alcohol dehydrogenase family)
LTGNRGLGAAIVEKFAAEGSNVAINFANREQPAVELAERLKKEYGIKTTVIQGVGFRYLAAGEQD